ncbi:MAG: M48 family metallopeptidase [Isosphaeraceae bacterium]
MMPIPLLIALLIAYGLDLSPADESGGSALSRLLQTGGGIILVAFASLGLGGWVARRVAHLGYASARVYRRYSQGLRLLTLLSLGTYAWILYRAGWSDLVLSRWGLQGLVLLDDLAVFLPYILIQLLVWTGQHRAERALHANQPFPRVGSYLTLRVRQSIGLILPVVLIFVFRQDVFARLWPQWHQTALAEPLELAALAVLILMVSPLFIRLAWPTRSLPDGPLRRRLEHVARRVGFRFNDLLIWDTGNLMVNACVTGVLPGFRYVLLSDALLETLNPAEVAAVFGHEVGHVAHRHLPFFGFFFLGTLAMLSLATEAVSIPASWVAWIPWVTPSEAPQVGEMIEGVAMLACLGLFFWFVFGYLSRRFERQADVFGCRVVSCGEADCPPHFDIDEGAAPSGANSQALCAVGIQIFCGALASVAERNGIEIAARSWRHGSIRSRLAFLRGLQMDPSGEAGFQRRVLGLRIVLVLFLSAALLLAVGMHSY